jgi:(p)ppGpp synthase/HD superfamily hydrolase
MTLERVAIILEALGDGMTQKDASMLAGISEDTLCNWKRTNSDFSDEMARKVVEYKQKLLKTIQKASEKDWKACAWLLERKYKKEFSTNHRLQEDILSDFPTLDFNMQRVVNDVIEQL